MPSLDQHQSNSIVKLLLIGDAMSAKTGSLVSLVKAGYRLRILDFDNKLDVLKQYILKECPDNAASVEYRTLRDKRKATAAGSIIDGPPRAFIEGLKMLDNWKYKNPDGSETDLGSPATWGENDILVIDSLSRLSDAAYDRQDVLTPTGRSGEKDGRAVYWNAQKDVEEMIAMLTSESFNVNVIVICHGQYMDMPDGTKKIFPQSVGSALGPLIPTYFPNMVRYKNVSGKRTMQLKSDAMIDLANAAPFLLGDTLDIETGLAKLFETLRGKPAIKPTEPNKVATLRRM